MLAVQTPGFMASPILCRAATENDPAWPALARTALIQPGWRGVIDYAVLMTPSLPDDLLSTVIDRAKDCPDVVWTASIRKQIPEATLLRILQDGADEVAGAAAAGEWQAEPQGHPTPSSPSRRQRTCSEGRVRPVGGGSGPATTQGQDHARIAAPWANSPV